MNSFHTLASDALFLSSISYDYYVIPIEIVATDYPRFLRTFIYFQDNSEYLMLLRQQLDQPLNGGIMVLFLFQALGNIGIVYITYVILISDPHGTQHVHNGT